MGLLNGVVPPEELMERVLAYASGLAEGVSPASLRSTRQQIYLDLHRGVGAAVEEAGSRLERMMREPDFAEGAAALAQKRPPRFSRP